MEEGSEVRASADPEEYKHDRGKSNLEVSSTAVTEQQSETPTRMQNNMIKIENGSVPTIPAENVPARDQLSSSIRSEYDGDNAGLHWVTNITLEILNKIGTEIEAKGLLRALSNMKMSDFSDTIDLSKDPENPIKINLVGCDETKLKKLKTMWTRLLETLEEDLPLSKMAALALSLKHGSLRLEGYTVSWKPSEIPGFVEYAYQYKDFEILKVWLAKASHDILQSPEEVAESLHSRYVRELVAKEHSTVCQEISKAKTNLSKNKYSTGDTTDDSWLALACVAKRGKALLRRTNETITKLRAAGFTRANLTLEKLSEFASNINSGELHLPTLVEYISSLPQVMEVQPSTSAVVRPDALDPQSNSDPVIHIPKRNNKRKQKKNQGQQNTAQVVNTSQTEVPSNTSILSKNTMPNQHDESHGPRPLDDDHTTAMLDDLPGGAVHNPLMEKFSGPIPATKNQRKNEKKKEKKKAKKGKAQPTPGGDEDAVEVTEVHQQYPVFSLAEPSLIAMGNSPTTYAYRTVQRPTDHRKIKSGTELELQKLQLPPEDLTEAKERLLSEPSPLSLQQVRDHTREIEYQSNELEQQNSRMTRGIVDLVRERSRSREATQELIHSDFGSQASDLDTHSTPSTELLSVPFTTPRQSMRRSITSSSLTTILESDHEEIRPLSAEELATRNRVLHRRCRSEPQDTYKTKVTDYQPPIVLGGHHDNEDLSDDEDEASEQPRDNAAVQARGPRREQHPYTPWTTTLEWQYYETNQELRAMPPGTRAYRFPRPVRVSTGDVREGDMSDCPVWMSPSFTDFAEPIITYNEDLDRYEIIPRSRPWRDIRSDTNHPDYLPPGKLCQYQAYEFAKFVVWRHDRDILYCKLSSCGQFTRDHDITTMICHGCGTKSRVRYCSKAHLIQDIPNHWKICGTPEEVYAMPMDPGSQPDRFYRRYPAITDNYEDPNLVTVFKNRSMQKHRQQTFAIFNKGQYTLFLGGSTTQVVTWPQHLAPIFKPRVERLLNLAFFSQSETNSILYLFCLLRYCLRLQNQWTEQNARILKMQFRLEFNYNTTRASEEDPCECYWAGDVALVKDCTPECRALLFDNFGVVFRGGGLKGILEHWEGQYWPLRIWQRQHPTVRGWEYRLYGEGFPNVVDYQRLGAGYVPVLGKGWEGFGAENGAPTGKWRVDA
ncbi:hypothetical protein MMC18_001304 [Xylographa bjoerkii]|nr:hypothetical protein [Xylographa bjoerkii]